MKILKETKDALSVITAVAMLGFGVLLTAAGFIVSPLGQIDDSVLWVLGQCLLYSGSIFGIGLYAKRRLDDMETFIRTRQRKDPTDEDVLGDIESEK